MQLSSSYVDLFNFSVGGEDTLFIFINITVFDNNPIFKIGISILLVFAFVLQCSIFSQSRLLLILLTQKLKICAVGDL